MGNSDNIDMSNDVLPEPTGPTTITNEFFGMDIFILDNTLVSLVLVSFCSSQEALAFLYSIAILSFLVSVPFFDSFPVPPAPPAPPAPPVPPFTSSLCKKCSILCMLMNA